MEDQRMPSFVSISPNNKRKRAAAENANRKIMRKRGKRVAVSVPDEEVESLTNRDANTAPMEDIEQVGKVNTEKRRKRGTTRVDSKLQDDEIKDQQQAIDTITEKDKDEIMDERDTCAATTDNGNTALVKEKESNKDMNTAQSEDASVDKKEETSDKENQTMPSNESTTPSEDQVDIKDKADKEDQDQPSNENATMAENDDISNQKSTTADACTDDGDKDEAKQQGDDDVAEEQQQDTEMETTSNAKANVETDNAEESSHKENNEEEQQNNDAPEEEQPKPVRKSWLSSIWSAFWGN
ncbi:hypothetical protein K492DRAFT_176889 [Lichtheimia hyalospora FSU 10163]|nr:hypothetical protein K492DRAFT_176889 [Lichtheimia hyalospora FSU 10163]